MPDWMRYVRQNLNLTHASPADEADAVEDIARQLEDAYLEGLNRGLSADEAEAQARLHITDWNELSQQLPSNQVLSTVVYAPQNEQSRRMGVLDWLESVTRDISYAARRLRRASGFTLVAVFTLGLGIAGNTAIFSAINSLLLNPAGLTDVNRILVFGVNYQKLNRRNGSVNTAEYMDVRDNKEAFKAAALGTFGNYNYTVAGFPERLVAQRVTCQWFEVFGVRPILGRLFTAEEDQPNANRVVILEHGTWQQLFGGDPSVIDRTIQLNQQAYKIIGVMGPEFRRRDVNFWTPLGLPLAAYSPRTRFN